jgi:tRNA (mo5U34)-methyltransferase
MTLVDEAALAADFAAIGLASWTTTLLPLVRQNLSDTAHGHLAEWREIVESLPISGEAGVDGPRTRELLLRLAPWRKGPFEIGNITIDAEWRSDLKWNRLRQHISPLAGRNVLDVGCGNGYYAGRMIEAGAARVIGVDPSVLFVAQFAAVRKLTGLQRAHVLPLRGEDLPRDARAFDTTFSMGVLSHRREPAGHLADLRSSLRAGGELVLETLVIPGEHDAVLEPPDRYARMRNVWLLPTTKALLGWVHDAGFSDARLVDVSMTTTAEQRTTAWMPFESLAAALDPADPGKTIEGLPAPTRAILIAGVA